MIFNYWIFGLVPHYFTLILVAVGIFYGVAFFWVCLRVKEGEYPPPPSAGSEKQGPLAGVKTYFRECFSQPYFLAVFVMMMAAGLTFLPVNTFSIPYAKSLGVDMGLFGKSLAFTFAISLCLAYFLGWLVDLFHPLRMVMFCLAGYAVVAVWGALFARTADAFLVGWVLHGVLSGCYFTCAASLGLRLFPRIKFAQFASASGIVMSLATMTISPLMGILIDQTHNTYRYTFFIGACLAVFALAAAMFVYRNLMRRGGLEKIPE